MQTYKTQTTNNKTNTTKTNTNQLKTNIMNNFNLNDFTPSNGAIQSLRELLYLTTLKSSALADIVTLKPGVRNGKKEGGIGEFDLVGTSQQVCNNLFNSTAIATTQQEWRLGNMTIAEKFCADDFIDTIAHTALQTGANVGDLTDSDILSYVIEPRLTQAIEKALWRYLWFGDIEAQNVSSGGIITDGLDIKYFNALDGFFKKLFVEIPTTSERYIKIDANYEDNKTKQISSINNDDEAEDLFEKLVYDVDMRMRQKKNVAIYVTQSLADALARDIKRKNRGSDLSWESLFDGFAFASQYNGIKVISLPIWDNMIRTYENLGNTYNKPHRAIVASPEMFWAGFESTDSIMPDLDIWYEKKDAMTYIKGRENFGTVLWESDLMTFAY